MKKVLFFINHFPSPSETFIKDEISYFKKAGFEVTVLCHFYKQKSEGIDFFQTGLQANFIKRFFKASQILLNGSFLRKIELMNFFKFGSNSLNLSLITVAEFFIKSKCVWDVIYCHFGTNGKYICQLKQAGIIPPETKIIVHFHGLDLSTSKYDSRYYAILNKYCDRIIIGSDLAAGKLKELGIYDESKVIKIPVSIDLSKFPEKEILEKINKVKILSVGRLIEWKGHLEAIEVINLFRNKYNIPFEFRIIGGGPLYNTLLNKIENYGLAEDVALLGEAEHAQVIELMYGADIFLYCGKIDKEGRQEMQGLAVCEALASNCIVISSEVGGVKEYIRHNFNGLLCASDDTACFANSIITIVNNAELRKKIALNARRTVLNEFDRNINYKNLIHEIFKVENID